MKEKSYFSVVGVLFSLISVAFLVVGINRWFIEVSSLRIPFWISLILFVIFGFVGIEGFRHSMSHKHLKRRR